MADNEREELSIFPKGDGYVLRRDDGRGNVTEIALSETNVVFLGRLSPTVARRILASRALARGDVSATVAAPVKNVELNEDLHDPLLLVRIRDEYDGEFDFSFSPSDARRLAERLIARADKIDARPKPKSH
jgi:hypothetical protein